MIAGQEGSMLLRGNAVTPEGIARDRYILIRDGRIQKISQRRPALTDDLPLLETRRGDFIFPGLLNLHSHSTYNFLPLWRSPGAPFENRHEWRNDAGYRSEVSGVAKAVQGMPGMGKTIGVFAELQAIAGGTAVLQEDQDLTSEEQLGNLLLCRDTMSAAELGLPPNSKIMSVVDFFRPKNRTSGPPDPQKSIGKYVEARERGELAATIVHLAEGRSGFGSNRGVDAYSRAEFEAFMALPELADADAVRKSPLSIVHGCGIDACDPRHVDFLLERDISIIWSPVSNLLLYGDTIDVETLLARGINVALGSDWAPSGSKHVWDEARFARAYFDATTSPVSKNWPVLEGRMPPMSWPVPDQAIFEMVTVNAARCLGTPHLGRIAEDAFADLFILRAELETDNPHEIFLATEDRHVLATIIGGRPIYGDRDFLEKFTQDVVSLPAVEGSAVRNKAVHLPPALNFDVDVEVGKLEAALKARVPEIRRSNLLVSSDKPYRRRIQHLKADLQRFGWVVQTWRHDGPSPTAGTVPVPPNAVRLWRGFRHAQLDVEAFATQLASTMLPAAVGLQAPLGLAAYLPALLPVTKPGDVPDEVALSFFESPDTHTKILTTAAGRTHALLHGATFDTTRSRSDAPERFVGSLQPGKPVYLFDTPVDWQMGVTDLYVGSRRDGVAAEQFLQAVVSVAASVQAAVPVGLDAAIMCVDDAHVLCWQHWTGEADYDGGVRAKLDDVAVPIMIKRAESIKTTPTLFWPSNGAAYALGDILNVKFERRALKPW